MSSRSEKKLQEGLQHVQDAEKHLKTGFLKWRPDYDSASVSFQNAALAFKLAKEFEKARSTYERLAECHYKLGSRFHAAKAFEEAGNACKEMKDYSKALSYYDRASDMYLENGTPDTAVLCLERAGKVVESINAEWSVSLYMKAADICQNEDDSRFRQAAELVGKAARLQVQTNKLSEAVNTIGHECQLLSQVEGGGESIPRLTCGLVLVHLHIGDPVRAEQAIHAASDYADVFESSEEQDALLRLVEGFNDEDQEKVDQVLNTPMFKYMDNAYAKLARSLLVPGYSAEKASPKAGAAKSPVAGGGGPPSDVTTRIAKQQAEVDHMTSKMNDLMNSAPRVTSTASGDGAPVTEGGDSPAPPPPVSQNPFEEEDDDLC